MNQSRVERQPAYLLHTRPYRDSSALLEAWTRDFGRVGLVAKGARRAKSPWRGLFESFQPLLISWVGKGELKTLRGLESDQLLAAPAGESLACAYYVNELLLRTCMRHDPHPGLYQGYAKMVELLAGGQVFESKLRYFENQLLAELGYGLDFHDDFRGDPINPGMNYIFVADQGAVPAAEVTEQTGEFVSGKLLTALAAQQLIPEQLGAAKRLMRRLLAPHLGGRPLESRRLWTTFSKLVKAGEAGN